MPDGTGNLRLTEFLPTGVDGHPLQEGEVQFLKVHEKRRMPFGHRTVCGTGVKHSIEEAAEEMTGTTSGNFRTGIGPLWELGVKCGPVGGV